MSQQNKKGLSYADAGVNIDAGNALVERIKPFVKSTARPGADGAIGGFGGLFDLKAAGYTDPVLVAANDGVGTKLLLAIEANNHGTIGIDLVAMCVNDLIVQGAEPLFFLDYLATGRLDVDVAAKVVEGIAAGCRLAGCALIGGETAEMPGMYKTEDYDLGGFAVGAVERSGLLPSPSIAAGDRIIGLASTGLHSNGFSLVRKIIKTSGAALDAPAPFEPGRTLGESLLTPTEIYVAPILAALRANVAIKGLVHITGGGISENLPRILPEHLTGEIDLSAMRPQPVFGWLQQTGGVAEQEMLRTFNCGTGMLVILAQSEVASFMGAAQSDPAHVFALGQVVPRGADPVSYRGKLSF